MKERRNTVVIKDFSTFMYDHTLHHGRKDFCHYCLQGFRAAEKLKIALKLMVNKLLRCLRRVNILHSKTMKEK